MACADCRKIKIDIVDVHKQLDVILEAQGSGGGLSRGMVNSLFQVAEFKTSINRAFTAMQGATEAAFKSGTVSPKTLNTTYKTIAGQNLKTFLDKGKKEKALLNKLLDDNKKLLSKGKAKSIKDKKQIKKDLNVAFGECLGGLDSAYKCIDLMFGTIIPNMAYATVALPSAANRVKNMSQGAGGVVGLAGTVAGDQPYVSPTNEIRIPIKNLLNEQDKFDIMQRGTVLRQMTPKQREAVKKGEELVVHYALDIVGFVDPWGVADGINFLLYLNEREKAKTVEERFKAEFGMFASAIGAVIPYAGDAVKLLKIGGAGLIKQAPQIIKGLPRAKAFLKKAAGRLPKKYRTAIDTIIKKIDDIIADPKKLMNLGKKVGEISVGITKASIITIWNFKMASVTFKSSALQAAVGAAFMTEDGAKLMKELMSAGYPAVEAIFDLFEKNPEKEIIAAIWKSYALSEFPLVRQALIEFLIKIQSKKVFGTTSAEPLPVSELPKVNIQSENTSNSRIRVSIISENQQSLEENYIKGIMRSAPDILKDLIDSLRNVKSAVRRVELIEETLKRIGKIIQKGKLAGMRRVAQGAFTKKALEGIKGQLRKIDELIDSEIIRIKSSVSVNPKLKAFGDGQIIKLKEQQKLIKEILKEADEVVTPARLVGKVAGGAGKGAAIVTAAGLAAAGVGYSVCRLFTVDFIAAVLIEKATQISWVKNLFTRGVKIITTGASAAAGYIGMATLAGKGWAAGLTGAGSALAGYVGGSWGCLTGGREDLGEETQAAFEASGLLTQLNALSKRLAKENGLTPEQTKQMLFLANPEGNLAKTISPDEVAKEGMGDFADFVIKILSVEDAVARVAVKTIVVGGAGGVTGATGRVQSDEALQKRIMKWAEKNINRKFLLHPKFIRIIQEIGVTLDNQGITDPNLQRLFIKCIMRDYFKSLSKRFKNQPKLKQVAEYLKFFVTSESDFYKDAEKDKSNDLFGFVMKRIEKGIDKLILPVGVIGNVAGRRLPSFLKGGSDNFDLDKIKQDLLKYGKNYAEGTKDKIKDDLANSKEKIEDRIRYHEKAIETPPRTTKREISEEERKNYHSRSAVYYKKMLQIYVDLESGKIQRDVGGTPEVIKAELLKRFNKDTQSCNTIKKNFGKQYNTVKRVILGKMKEIPKEPDKKSGQQQGGQGPKFATGR